jgi:hypothetical protein
MLFAHIGQIHALKYTEQEKYNNIYIIDRSDGSITEIDRIIDHIVEMQYKVEEYFGQSVIANIEIGDEKGADARTEMDGNTPLIYFSNKQLKTYSEEELNLVIVHEFIHAFQSKYTTIRKWKNRIAQSLYLEGSAVYYSSLILPGYYEWKYISYYRNDDSEYKIYKEQEKDVWKYLKENIKKPSRDSMNVLFVAGNANGRKFHPRIGYYIGNEIIKEIAREEIDIMSIKENEFMMIISNK